VATKKKDYRARTQDVKVGEIRRRTSPKRVKNVNWIPHGPLTGAKKRRKRGKK
jgi:hypothetical protein